MAKKWPRAGRVSAALLLSVALASGAAACSGGDASPAPGTPVSGTATRGAFTPIKADAKVGLSFPVGSKVEPALNAALKKAGFSVESRFARNGDDQDRYVGMLLESKPAVLVIEAVDTGRLKMRLDQAEKAGVVVIAATTLPMDDDTIDYYVGADPKLRGEAQAEAVLTGVTGRRTQGPPRVEVMAGRSDDVAAKIQYDATFAKLQPKLDDKSLEMPSGGKDFGRSALAAPSDAKAKMAALLKDKYGDQAPEGVVAPDDEAAVAATEAVAEAKRTLPYVVGARATYQGVRDLMQGRLGATTWDDPAALAASIAQLVGDLKGKDWPVTDKTSINTGRRDVGTRMLSPIAQVTRANAASVLKGDPELVKLTG
ncbi:MAG: substrate-binding domain-containing protein [Austwickia sp.]|nr:substrate-binding domain-containing protein [Austwickia sp.]MCO5308502.1 substrate-binding domain-containing protein [Austwickia sp.]